MDSTALFRMMDWQKTSANIRGARHSLYAPDFRECNSTSVDKMPDSQFSLGHWHPSKSGNFPFRQQTSPRRAAHGIECFP